MNYYSRLYRANDFSREIPRGICIGRPISKAMPIGNGGLYRFRCDEALKLPLDNFIKGKPLSNCFLRSEACPMACGRMMS